MRKCQWKNLRHSIKTYLCVLQFLTGLCEVTCSLLQYVPCFMTDQALAQREMGLYKPPPLHTTLAPPLTDFKILPERHTFNSGL